MTVMTVNGALSPEALGTTLAHEHLFINLLNQATASCKVEKVEKKHFPLLHRNPYALSDNLRLDDFDDAVAEVCLFKQAGGDTLVDCTPMGIGRDPEKLQRVSAATGINIVMGCGYYTYDTHPAELKDWSAENIRDEMVTDLLEGVGDAKIKAGIIGEIGTSKEIPPDEFKVLSAAAMASHVTGAAIQVHTYPWATKGCEAADFLIARGVAPDRIVICHTDVVLDQKYILELLERGVWLQFDNFGKEFTPDVDSGFARGTFASDLDRIKMIKFLVEAGWEAQLLFTTDICLKCLLKKYGGQGYSHIPVNVVVKLRDAGITEMMITQFLVKNPAKMLNITQ